MHLTHSNLFHAAFMQAWNAIVITEADPANGYRVQMANPAFCKMTGYALEELQGRTLKILQGPQTDATVIERLRGCLKEHRYFEGTTVNYRKDGACYVVRWNISPVRDESGTVTHFVSVQQDLTEYVRAERENRLLARALDASSDPVLLTDAKGEIIFTNSAFAGLTGYSSQEIKGQTPALLRSGELDPSFYDALHDALSSGKDFRGTFINRRKDGSLYYAEQSIAPIRDEHGQITHYVSVSKDISDRVANEQSLLHDATHDKLTDLYNRHFGEKLLNQAHAEASAHTGLLSLLVCDIDHFKSINDRYGHLAGDRALRDFAHILKSTVRGTDAVIRWGGEEFVVVLKGCPLPAAMDLAERIRAKLHNYHDAEVDKVTVSIGVSHLNPDETLESFFNRGDAALYDAKHQGRDRVAVAKPWSATR